MNVLAFLSKLDIRNRLSIIFYFAILNIKVRFKNTQIGYVWTALEPLIYFIVLYTVFTSIRGRTEDLAIYILTGLMLYQIFAKGSTGGIGVLTTNGGILQSIKIKKDFFPLVSTVAAGLISIITIGVFFALLPVFQFVPEWTIILVLIPVLLVLVIVLGLTYLLSIINVYVRDIKNIWPIIVLSLLFMSPILWNPENVDGVLLQIHEVNPLGQLIDIAHKLVLDGEIPPLIKWVYPISFSFGILILGYFIFHRLEDRIVEEL